MPFNDDPREAIRRRAEVWKQAEPELREARIRDAAEVSVPEAIRQLFTGMEHLLFRPSSPTSGLVEQQMWFTRIREAAGKATRRLHE